MPERKPKLITFAVYYTKAPEAYDGFGTITLETAEKSGKYDLQGNQLRAVGILEKNLDWQLSRYGSGMYGAYTDDEVNEFMGMN